MPVKGEFKKDAELSQTYAAIRMRKIRAQRRLENEQKYLQENRVNSKHYNNKWSEIREAKPDYSADPTYDELQKRKKEQKTQQHDSDNDSNENEDNDIDVSVITSVKLPDIDDVLDDDMIDEALDEVEKELTKQQRKNKKRREKLKQLKKGNKITEDETPLNEEAD